MHGRLKVKTTAEQDETKRKEREKKLKLYQAGTARIFEKRKAKEYDGEMLTLTADLLSANPDFYSIWNVRREVFVHLLATDPGPEVELKLENERLFMEQCLRINPKSYGTWHHRSWVLEHMGEPGWSRELALCNKFLEYDERNFHCWDYRRFVVKSSGVSAEDELAFTSEKIESNFSNYSSWHYRSKLLPLVHGDLEHPVGVKEEQLIEECLLAQNAFFTDPSDQSAWFYHKWLLGRVSHPLRINSVHVSRCEDDLNIRIVVALSQPFKLGEAVDLSVTVNNTPVCSSWRSSSGETYATVWVSEACVSTGDLDVSVSLSGVCHTTTPSTVQVKTGQKTGGWRYHQKPGTTFRHELGAVRNDTLVQELEALKQLHDLEPDNKWVLLTLVSLMRALDPLLHQDDTFSYIKQLLLVDPMRTSYYTDLKSKFLVENYIEQLPENTNNLDLSHKNLTTLAHTDHLVTMETIDLSHNSLRDISAGHHLQCVRQLTLDDNNIQSCDSFSRMASLEVLSLKNNNISTVDDVYPLRQCTRLRYLHLHGNPVCASLDTSNHGNPLPGVEVCL